MKLYGSVSNRFEEGKNYNKDRLIHENDDITMYYWSDRTCYFVHKVIDQKNIVVGRYYVCADHDKKGGMGHQDWLYFKTLNEMDTYLSKYFKDHSISEKKDYDLEHWAFKNNKWKRVETYDLDSVKELCKKRGFNFENYLDYLFTPTQKEKILNGKVVNKYSNLSGNVSFGVRDYYYDWEF